MIKQIDITKNVMGDISRFEKRRSRKWLSIFVAALLILVGIISFGIWQVQQSFFDPEFRMMLPMYTQDWDTFSESWKEALGFIWENMPQIMIIVGVLAIVIFFIILVFTRRRRAIVVRRLKETKKYQ